MDRGLYIAASGMVAEMARQDTLANDLANASTPGYKSDRVAQASFGELLLADRSSGAAVGPLGLGAEIRLQVTDLSPAAVRDTGEPLDFAIEGEGFFAVSTPQGVRLTRNGQFSASARGMLVTAEGHEVLGPDRRPVAVRDGAVDGARIGVFAASGARKAGDNLLAGTTSGAAGGRGRAGGRAGAGAGPGRALGGVVASGRAVGSGPRGVGTGEGGGG
ncbi:MAG: flagellar hook-basal body complex protein, partial [Solirubrobacteraceae bacterium]|nr:flagellar hook-basal body complex protein [Solirubrobacteraceae bacterium]